MTPIRIYDNTAVKEHRTCNRKHFFRHALNINRDSLSPPLSFGLGWHSAMDVVWPGILELDEKQDHEQILDLAKRAYAAWEADWTEGGFPSAEDMTHDDYAHLKARTPDTAVEMILGYILERWDRLRHQQKLIAVEQPFVVPLDPDDPTLWYSGRLDKVVEIRGKIWVIDHKTTSSYAVKGDFQRSFLDSWSPDSQMDGYAYGAWMLYGDDFGGIYIDGALVHKNHHDKFCWLPLSRSKDHLDSWLWETREEIRRMEADYSAAGQPFWTNHPEEGDVDLELTFASKEGESISQLSYLPAAPKSTGACWNFNSPCAYSELCKSWGNPLKGLTETGLPRGYIIDEWSPFDDEQRDAVEQLIKKYNQNG